MKPEVVHLSDYRPGGYKSQQQGCTCPMMDNCHGEGRRGDGARWGWYVSGSCKIHGKEGAHEHQGHRAD